MLTKHYQPLGGAPVNYLASRLPLGVAASAALLLSLVACSGSPAPTPAPDSTVSPVAQVTQSSSSTPKPAVSDADVKKYFKAIASNDEDTMKSAAENLAAPKSVAAAYALHLAAVNAADLDGGNGRDPDTFKDRGTKYLSCTADDHKDDDCTAWTDVKLSGGKVADFKVNTLDIGERISLGSGDQVKIDELAKVRFISAYQSVTSNALYVTFELKSRDEKITPNLGGAKYRSPSGRQATAYTYGGPDDLDANSTTHGYAVFKGAKPGGVVTLDFYDSDYSDHFVKIKTR